MQYRDLREWIERVRDLGELRDVHAAGYPNFFGMAGLHGLFHTPADSAAGTGPEILEPVVGAFAATLTEVSPAR